MGRILLGVVIGVILVIWLLASCVGAIFWPAHSVQAAGCAHRCQIPIRLA